jgi:hypothetical protein
VIVHRFERSLGKIRPNDTSGESIPKSDKATVNRRINELGQLLLTGAKFPAIRQYASDQGWEVSDCQLHRYLEAADKRRAETTHRDRRQLSGGHRPQRKALAAGRGKILDIAEQALHATVPRGEAWAVGFALKTLDKKRGYVAPADTKHGGDLNPNDKLTVLEDPNFYGNQKRIEELTGDPATSPATDPDPAKPGPV